MNSPFLDSVFDKSALDCLGQNSFSNPMDHCILGGGLSGILLALRLSAKQGARICLVEGEASLGGRIFYSPTWQVNGNAQQRSLALVEIGLYGRKLSGPGFEVFESQALQSIERHILSLLNEEETGFLEDFCQKNTSGMNLSKHVYVVKKEVSSIQDYRSSNTEMFTRKDAESMNVLLDALNDLLLKQKEVSNEADEFIASHAHSALELKALAFENFETFKEMPKAQKETLQNFLECICGVGFVKSPALRVATQLQDVFKRDHEHASGLFRRDSGLEFALEFILRRRGVSVLTQTNAVRLTAEKGTAKCVMVAGTDFTGMAEITSKHVHICCPLARSLHLLGRDQWSAGQSKLLAKFRPRSLVTLEIQNAESWLREVKSGQIFCSGDQFYFPVEKSFGLVSSMGHVQISAWMDYEDSLQAPPVREAVGRLKKAAARVFTTDGLDHIFSKKNPFAPRLASERVVLLPVGCGTPFEVSANDLCSDVKTRAEGVSVCGDGLSLHDEAWRNIVASVQQSGSL
jgi:hypothetical protein